MRRGRKKGTPKTGGRQRGTPNKATVEAKEIARGIIGDPAYLKNLRARMISGAVAPAVEALLFHYLFGKPKERIELGADKSLSRLIAEATGLVPPDDGTT